MHKQQRTSSARNISDRLKLHRRVIRLDGKEFTVITLRPGTRVRYSTNYYHGTWHILSDLHGARLFSRLLWGLSFQRKPGTFVVIEPDFLDPNPFDSRPADPIVLVPRHLTHLCEPMLRQLRFPLRTPPLGTVRWLTHGLDADTGDGREANGHIRQASGMLVMSGYPDALRTWARLTANLGEWRKGTDFTFLAGKYWWAEGELQIFNDYHRRVSAARVARREVLARPKKSLSPANLNQVIWRRCTAVRARRGYL